MARFYQDYERDAYLKIQNKVEFPLQGLDVSALAGPVRIDPLDDEKQPIYDIFAVINHGGDTVHGHYTAFVEYGDGMWYDKDDTSSEPVSSSDVVTQKAYILFYRRRKNGQTPQPYKEPPSRPAWKPSADSASSRLRIPSSSHTTWAGVNPYISVNGATSLEILAELETLREQWKLERAEILQKEESKEEDESIFEDLLGG